MFFKAALPAITNFDKFLQTEEPLIHCLHDQMQSFLHKLASKVVKHVAGQIRYNVSEPKGWWRFDCRFVNDKKSNELLDEGDITDNNVDTFFDAVSAFYEAEYEHCIKWLPAGDTLYKNSTFIVFFKRELLKFDHITELLAKFPKRLSNYIANTQELDTLEE